MADPICTLAIVSGVQVRKIDEKSRSAEFVAATEGGVETWHGREYLDMDGANLERYRANPVLLDSHNMHGGVENIVGRTEVSIEDRKLIAKAVFAETEKGEQAWTLTRDDFLRTLSVSFMPTKRLHIEEGEEAKLGDRMIQGPATIVREWELYEISVVSVPADADALKRGYVETLTAEQALALRDELNQRFFEGVTAMAKAKTATKPAKGKKQAQGDPDPAKPEENKGEATEGTTEQAAAPSPAAAPAPEAPPMSERKVAIYDICPRGLEDLAEDLVLAGKTVDESRAAFKKALDESRETVGTPEPVTQTAAGTEGDEGSEELTVEGLDDTTVKRAIGG